jgi:cell division protein FtsB
MRVHTATTSTIPAREAPRLPRRKAERRWLRTMMLLAGVIILADGLIGEQSLSTGYRARQQFAAVGGEIARLRDQNNRLRDEIRRLREDPETIEFVARRDLGLARPGEILVVLK